MIEIDGAEKSGSGALVRCAMALCTLTGSPLHMVRIRAKREKPGLRPQHLMAVKACASMCGGRVEGAEVGSSEIAYYPGKISFAGGERSWDIGTAGSATMLAFTLVPIALFSAKRSRFFIKGGLFQDFAPTAYHMQNVLFPLLARMGAAVKLEVARPGYVPLGKGEIVVSVEPLSAPLGCFRQTVGGDVERIEGLSLASHLSEAAVARRMAEKAAALLRREGCPVAIEIIEDASAAQKGAAFFLSARTQTGCILGMDRAGRRGRSSESIAEHVVRSLLEDLGSGATVDRFTADQVVLFAGLARGRSKFLVPQISDHVVSNLWLIEKILGAVADVSGKMITVDGVGFFSGS